MCVRLFSFKPPTKCTEMRSLKLIDFQAVCKDLGSFAGSLKSMVMAFFTFRPGGTSYPTRLLIPNT